MRFLLALFLLLAFNSAEATNRYWCRCDTGADPACQAPANDSGDGLTPATAKTSFSSWNTAWQAAHAGDQLLLCKGGAWDSWNIQSKAQTDSLSAYIANNLIVDSYTSNLFTSSAKPLLNTPTGCTAYDQPGCTAFWLKGNVGAWGGITIRNIAITGNDGAFTQGIAHLNQPQNFTYDNLTISHIGGAFGCQALSSQKPFNITFRNGTVSYVLDMGITSFGCYNMTFEGNNLDHTAYGAKAQIFKALDHAFYISGNETGSGGDTFGVILRNNTMTNTCLGANEDPNRCNCAIVTGHSLVNSWLIENNYIYQAPGTAAGGCYGLSIAPGNNDGTLEYEKYTTWRSNKVVGAGNIGIFTTACQNCIFENNVVVKEEAWDNFVGIRVDQMPFAIVTNNSADTFWNNSTYILQATDTSYCYYLGGSGTGHKMYNNLCIYGSGGPGSLGYCFGSDLSASAFGWDNNLCFNFAGWFPGFATKAAFSAGRSGADTNGISADPVLVGVPSSSNGYSMQIQTTSPAKNAGNTSNKARLAFQGYPAVGVRDIGAYEFGSNP